MVSDSVQTGITSEDLTAQLNAMIARIRHDSGREITSIIGDREAISNFAMITQAQLAAYKNIGDIGADDIASHYNGIPLIVSDQTTPGNLYLVTGEVNPERPISYSGTENIWGNHYSWLESPYRHIDTFYARAKDGTPLLSFDRYRSPYCQPYSTYSFGFQLPQPGEDVDEEAADISDDSFMSGLKGGDINVPE